jgi:6-pyruvoyl-tetrahydropterin synthase
MWVEIEMWGDIDPNGIMNGMEFGDVKKVFRHYLDTEFDHRTLLSQHDPLAGLLYLTQPNGLIAKEPIALPGLAVCREDPTTENIARWIGAWCVEEFEVPRLKCVVHETAVNMASWEWEK